MKVLIVCLATLAIVSARPADGDGPLSAFFRGATQLPRNFFETMKPTPLRMPAEVATGFIDMGANATRNFENFLNVIPGNSFFTSLVSPLASMANTATGTATGIAQQTANVAANPTGILGRFFGAGQQFGQQLNDATMNGLRSAVGTGQRLSQGAIGNAAGYGQLLGQNALGNFNGAATSPMGQILPSGLMAGQWSQGLMNLLSNPAGYGQLGQFGQMGQMGQNTLNGFNSAASRLGQFIPNGLIGTTGQNALGQNALGLNVAGGFAPQFSQGTDAWNSAAALQGMTSGLSTTASQNALGQNSIDLNGVTSYQGLTNAPATTANPFGQYPANSASSTTPTPTF